MSIYFGYIQNYRRRAGQIDTELHPDGKFESVGFSIETVRRTCPQIALKLEQDRWLGTALWYTVVSSQTGKEIVDVWSDFGGLPPDLREDAKVVIRKAYVDTELGPSKWIERLVRSIWGDKRHDELCRERAQVIANRAEVKARAEAQAKEEARLRAEAQAKEEEIARAEARARDEEIARARLLAQQAAKARAAARAEAAKARAEAQTKGGEATPAVVISTTGPAGRIALPKATISVVGSVRVTTTRSSQARITLSARAIAIKLFCEQRGIARLMHFTRVENLGSIAKFGLLGPNELTARNLHYSANDPLRLERQRGAVCLSISFPNYLLFYRLWKSSQSHWAVIELDSAVLWELDCAFCRENAASTNVANIPLEMRKSSDSLAAMYSDYGSVARNVLGIPANYPTNPQAEVLCFDPVPRRYIKSIGVRDLAGLSSTKLSAGVSIRPELFAPRSDWSYWKKASSVDMDP